MIFQLRILCTEYREFSDILVEGGVDSRSAAALFAVARPCRADLPTVLMHQMRAIAKRACQPIMKIYI
jgi:hypothetical protein